MNIITVLPPIVLNCNDSLETLLQTINSNNGRKFEITTIPARTLLQLLKELKLELVCASQGDTFTTIRIGEKVQIEPRIVTAWDINIYNNTRFICEFSCSRCVITSITVGSGKNAIATIKPNSNEESKKMIHPNGEVNARGGLLKTFDPDGKMTVYDSEGYYFCYDVSQTQDYNVTYKKLAEQVGVCLNEVYLASITTDYALESVMKSKAIQLMDQIPEVGKLYYQAAPCRAALSAAGEAPRVSFVAELGTSGSSPSGSESSSSK